METARLFDIQRGSTVDGPGIRTVFFFHGCPMRCAWCHNPEGIGLTGGEEPAVREYTLRELADIAAEDIPFYRPDGGVTASGGECMLQSEFLAALFRECKHRGIRTAIDTAGDVPFEHFLPLLDCTDLFLYDIKCLSSERHRAFTGVGNERILQNLCRLFESGAAVHIRIPLIPECNGTEEEMLAIRDFLRPYRPKEITLLPYHTLGYGKYRRLGLAPPSFTVPSEAEVAALRKLFAQ
ncbi:MAG: radical SAM protein [Clostridia bacterium]|nr:radical SAM protein [Clostridia bacterium]